jgi:ubiquinol-cytochrome c reductase cytochrome b subunit
MPEMGGYFLEHPNFDPADPMVTPPHIAPVWYFTPFYAILRAVPSFVGQVWGVLAMGAAIVMLFFLPWLDRSPVKSIRYRGFLFKLVLAAFVISFLILGYLGALPTTPGRTTLAQICTDHLLRVLLRAADFLPAFEKTKPVPERVTK